MKPGHLKRRRSLEEILQSTSDALFPAQLGKKKVKVNSRDVEGDTPLHVMALRQDRHAVAVLIQAGAKVNAVGDMGETPLHVAVSRGDLVITESLLRAGANPDIRCEFGDTARERAIKAGGALAKLLKGAPADRPRAARSDGG